MCGIPSCATPNHKRSIPAFAFLFTKKERATVAIASSYTHLDKIPVDPHLAGNRFLKEAQIVVDKHYGYFNLADIPHQYLVVLPARLDDIRPKIIEDQQAPNRSLDSELLREAKRTEADFWHTITREKRYDILEVGKGGKLYESNTPTSNTQVWTSLLHAHTYCSEVCK